MSDMSNQTGGAGYRPAGWYHAQGDPPGTQRFWDGAAWQGGPEPVRSSPDQGTSSGSERSAAYGPPPTSGAAPAVGVGSAPPAAPAVSANNGAGGLVSALFDPSFTSFITRRAVSAVYILVMIAVGLMTLFFVLSAASGGGVGILLGLIVGPLIGLLYLVMIRMTLEFFVNQFRQTELLEVIAQKLGADANPPA